VFVQQIGATLPERLTCGREGVVGGAIGQHIAGTECGEQW
jgi:hypothetical protein